MLDDGTPMPTRYWLVGPDGVRRVRQLEATGGVAPPRRRSTPRSSPPPTAGTRPSATRWFPTTTPARDRGRGRRHANRRQVPARPLGLASRRRRRPGRPLDRRAARAASRGAHHARRVGDGDAVHERTSTGPAGTLWTTDPVGRRQPHGDRVRRRPTPITRPAHQRPGRRRRPVRRRRARAPRLIDIAAVLVRRARRSHAGPTRAGSDDVAAAVALDRAAAEEIFRLVATESARERAHNPGLPSEHVDTIVATCCIVLSVMRRFHLDQVTIA